MRRQRIAELLPTVFRRALPHSPPLAAVLGVMEAMHAPSERVLAHFDEALHPYAAPDRFVPWLAQWMGLHPILGDDLEILGTDTRRARDLIAMSSVLAKWRGTARGLILFLELATGLSGFEIDEPRPFHFTLHTPPDAEAQRELITRIVAAEKPAYVTCEVRFGVDRQ